MTLLLVGDVQNDVRQVVTSMLSMNQSTFFLWPNVTITVEAILIIIVSDYEIQHLGEAIPEDWAP